MQKAAFAWRGDLLFSSSVGAAAVGCLGLPIAWFRRPWPGRKKAGRSLYDPMYCCVGVLLDFDDLVRDALVEPKPSRASEMARLDLRKSRA